MLRQGIVLIDVNKKPGLIWRPGLSYLFRFKNQSIKAINTRRLIINK